MTHDPSRSDLRDLIVRRRASFISAALAGIGAAATVQACTPAPAPAQPPPQSPGAPAPPAEDIPSPTAAAPPAAATASCNCPTADAGASGPATDAAEPEALPPRRDLLHPDAAPSICLSDMDIGAEPL